MDIMKKNLKKYWQPLAIGGLTLIGFLYRINGLEKNYSFWADEASTARFGRGVLITGFPKISITGYYERAYYLTHYLTGLSFKIFGVNEFAARLPEVIFGTLVILAVFYLAKEIFNKYVGLGASLLTTFSYIQIAWSKQARGYVILEFFFLTTLLFLWRFLRKRDKKSLLFLLISLALSIFTHTLGIILIPIVLALFLFYSKKRLPLWFWLGGSASLLILGFAFLGWQTVLNVIWNRLKNLTFLRENFIWYYHSLFWRQYSLISFLSLVAILELFFRRGRKKAIFFLTAIFIYLSTICFFLGVPFEKYALVIFPLLFILSAYGLMIVTTLLTKRDSLRKWLFFLLVIFIIANGNKFSLKPKRFYSLNFDMREIPEIDDKGAYLLAKNKIVKAGIDINNVAFVDIDADAIAWYMGEGVNGFDPRKDIDRSIVIDKNRNYRYIRTLKELKKVRKKFPYGFVMLIEHNYRFYPAGFTTYVRRNLRLEKEEQFAPFAPDWDRWPIEFYSWGFNNADEK